MYNHSDADSTHVETIEKVLNAIIDVFRNTIASHHPGRLKLLLHFQNSSSHRLHHRRVAITDDIECLVESKTSKVRGQMRRQRNEAGSGLL